MTKKARYFIDLFSGCGGLSLGLEQAGFVPALFSELNEDARNSYLINRIAKHPHLEEFSIPDIRTITNRNIRRAKNYRRRLKHRLGIDCMSGGLDLLVGGPPCQGFSVIGHRRSYKIERKELPSNHLYKRMEALIRVFKPNAFLFENVRGLLHAQWSEDGEPGEIWKDVLRTFKRIPGYRVKWSLVHAKDYGVPQNRPRILLVGLKEGIAKNLPDFDDAVESGYLPPPLKAPYVSVVDAIGDLIDKNYQNGGATDSYPAHAMTAFQRAMRTDPRTGAILPKGSLITEHKYSNHSDRIRQKFEYMIENRGKIPARLRTKKFRQIVLPSGAWGNGGPTITTTSMPDDYVHYLQPRTLSVREWARLQTFPDWYQFTGPRTTGGLRRAGNPTEGNHHRTVPRYTQIGNAVPVNLAVEVGKHLMKLLTKYQGRR